MPVNFIAGDGHTPTALTDVRDVGKFTARIIADPRTINKMVLVYGAVLSQNQVFNMLDKMSGETTKRDYVSVYRQFIYSDSRIGYGPLWLTCFYFPDVC